MITPILHDSTEFVAADGTILEIVYAPVSTPRGIIMLWPGMGVDVKLYRFPVERFRSRGFSVILYNPRGHGFSGGMVSRHIVLEDIRVFIEKRQLADFPFILVAHSAGCDGILRLSASGIRSLKRYLVSPILDPHFSLLHMYARGSVSEFISLIAARSDNYPLVMQVLADTRWFDEAVWRLENYRERLDDCSGAFRIGQFLEEYFVHGYNAFPLLIGGEVPGEVILPDEDTWFPVDETARHALAAGLPVVTMNDAGGHFLTRAWPRVWGRIEKDFLN